MFPEMTSLDVVCLNRATKVRSALGLVLDNGNQSPGFRYVLRLAI